MLIPAAASPSSLIDCGYTNAERTLQIVRINEPATAYLERTVLPGQRLLFKAPADAILEIHTASFATAIYSDSIPCVQLEVQLGARSGLPGSVLSTSVSEKAAEKRSSVQKVA